MFRNRTFSIAAAIATAAMLGVYAIASPSGHGLRPHQIRTAPPINPNTTYPFGAENGESVWIDSASGPQQVLVAPLIATTSGSPNQIIAGTAGKRIRVLGVVLTNAIAGTAQFQDEAGTPNKLSGVLTLAANGQFIVPTSRYGYIDTLPGAALDVATTGSSNIQGGFVVYCLH